MACLPSFVVAIYDTGDDRLPLLRPALDAAMAMAIATHAARNERRPTVRVFVCEDGQACEVMVLRI